MNTKEMLANMTAEEKEALYAEIQASKSDEKRNRRDAYEGLRAQFMHDVFSRIEPLSTDVREMKDWLDKESEGFKSLMHEYGQTRSSDQESYTITDGDLKLEVRSNKVKTFDERADMAAERLVDYLNDYVAASDKGREDPMYQLAMTLLERNRQGDLDYKSISKLYEMEGKFDGEYSEIMDLFRESNTITKTAVNYYFSKKDKQGVWHKIEPSFCRL